MTVTITQERHCSNRSFKEPRNDSINDITSVEHNSTKQTMATFVESPPVITPTEEGKEIFMQAVDAVTGLWTILDMMWVHHITASIFDYIHIQFEV